MARLIGGDKKMGDGRTVWPQKDGREKIRGPTSISAMKAVISQKEAFRALIDVGPRIFSLPSFLGPDSPTVSHFLSPPYQSGHLAPKRLDMPAQLPLEP